MSEQIGESVYSLEQLSDRANELFAIKGLARQLSKGNFATVDGLYVVRLAGAYIHEPEDVENEPMEVVPPSADRFTLVRTQLIVGRTQFLLRSNKYRQPCMTWTPGLSTEPSRGPGMSGLLSDEMIADLSDGLMHGQPFDPERQMIREDADGMPYIVERKK